MMIKRISLHTIHVFTLLHISQKYGIRTCSSFSPMYKIPFITTTYKDKVSNTAFVSSNTCSNRDIRDTRDIHRFMTSTTEEETFNNTILTTSSSIHDVTETSSEDITIQSVNNNDDVDFLRLDPSDIEFIPVKQSFFSSPPAGLIQKPNDFMTAPTHDTMETIHKGTNQFVNMFRGSAAYIASHRNAVVVYHIPGEFLDTYSNKEGFADLMDDIALTWLLGMKIVLVVGCRKSSISLHTLPF